MARIDGSGCFLVPVLFQKKVRLLVMSTSWILHSSTVPCRTLSTTWLRSSSLAVIECVLTNQKRSWQNSRYCRGLSIPTEPIPTSWGVGLVGRTMALFKSLSSFFYYPKLFKTSIVLPSSPTTPKPPPLASFRSRKRTWDRR